MFTVNKIRLLLLTGIFFLNWAHAEPTEESKCAQQVEQTVKKLNVLYISHHLDPIHFDAAQLKFDRHYNQFKQLNVWRFYIAPDTSMDCLPRSCEVFGFLRDTPDNPPLYNSKPVPNWTLNQAAEEAKPWVQTVLGYFPPNLSAPRGTFDSDMRDAKRYYDGQWLIRWQRTDSQGHLFEMDGLTANMSEKYGSLGFRLNFDSTFEEVHGKLISSEEALAAARAPAEILLNNRNLAGPFIPPGLHLGDAKTALFIVNPNNILQCKTMDQVKNQLAARLAWRVEYTLMDGDVPASYHTMIIRIDAQTKEVLGGDFK